MQTPQFQGHKKPPLTEIDLLFCKDGGINLAEIKAQDLTFEDLKREFERMQKTLLRLAEGSPKKPTFIAVLRLPELGSYLLPPKVRRENFEPAFHDIKGDFLKAQKRFTSRRERQWLSFCFGLHTSVLVCQSAWAALSDRAKRALLRWFRNDWRNWWGGVS